MKSQVYFVRQEKKDQNGNMHQHPYAAVSIGVMENLERQNTYCRGISICSETDPFDRKFATAKAHGLMIKACVNAKSSVPVTPKYTNPAKFIAQTGFSWHSEYDVQPTDQEKKIVEIAIEQNDDEPLALIKIQN